MVDAVGVGIEGEYFRALAEEVDEVAAESAAGVEDASFGGDVSARIWSKT